MLARVAVASDALDLGTTVSAPAANTLHRTLVEALLAHGRLVFSSDAEVLAFIRALRSVAGMPPLARSRWEEMLVHLKRCGRIVIADFPNGTALAAIDAIDSLRAAWGGQVDVAVVADALCVVLGIPEDTGILSAPGFSPDVAVVSAAASSPVLSRIHELQQHPVAAHGSEREIFWSTVLAPMAAGAATATVLDGYLFNRIADIAHGRARASAAPEHVFWLLGHLDGAMADGATVRLIGNADKITTGEDARGIAQLIRDRWSPARLARVEVLLGAGAGTGGRRFPHDRHIRFSTGSALKITAGFDRLREERIWDASGMWWTYLWQSDAIDLLREEERAAESLSRRREASALV